MTKTFGRSEEQGQAGGIYKTLSFLFISILLLLLDARLEQTQLLRQGLQYVLIPSDLTLSFLVKQNKTIRSYFSLNRQQWQSWQELELRNIYLEERLAALGSLERENEELRHLLSYKHGQEQETPIIAQVIGQKTNIHLQELVVDKGTVDGVRNQLSVMARKGLMGQTIAVGPYTSRVLLITDIRHATPVMVARNRNRFILHGTGDSALLLARDVDSNVDVQLGDKLITSGLGDLFPAGLAVAEVIKIDTEKRHSFRQVWARPLMQAHITQFILMSNKTL